LRLHGLAVGLRIQRAILVVPKQTTVKTVAATPSNDRNLSHLAGGRVVSHCCHAELVDSLRGRGGHEGNQREQGDSVTPGADAVDGDIDLARKPATERYAIVTIRLRAGYAQDCEERSARVGSPIERQPRDL